MGDSRPKGDNRVITAAADEENAVKASEEMQETQWR
ncbi:hypothetical protein BKA01_002610 [Pseudonocardia eucalypti]|nr:hypothetical protein [Pseudonocardia eucalypti]